MILRQGIGLSYSLLLASLSLSTARWAYGAEYDAIPKAASLPTTTSTDYSLWLTLSTNGRNDGVVTQVKVHQQHYLVAANVLKNNFIPTPTSNGWIDVNTLADVQVTYDSAHQVLALTVPNNWLPTQSLGDSSLASQNVVSSQGLLFNYDVYSINNSQQSRYSAIWLEQRYFSNKGYLSNTGTFRQNWRASSGSQQGYLRYDTTWRYSDIDHMVSYQLGDLVSNSLSWSNSVRLGGIRISRNFSIRPDLVTYPLLSVSGTAAVPGSVDLFINGYKTSNNSVNAGPWTLTNTPYINGAGEATVVTTDALGRQVETSIPFYVANQLLSPGLSDYDFSAGALRTNYGSKSADYNAGAVSSYYRYGLSNHITLAVEGEGRQGLVKGGLGLDIAPWRWGTLSLSSSQSYSQQVGQQFSVGYSWVSSLFNLNLSHLQRTHNFSDLSVYGTETSLSKHAEQGTLSFSPFGRGFGNIGLGYFDITSQDNTRTRLANLSWSKSFWHNSSFNLSLSKTLGSGGISGQLQWVLPLENDSSISVSDRRESNSRTYQSLTYSHATPTQGGLGWDLAASSTSSGYRQADISWKNDVSLISGGVYGSSSDHHQWLDVSGSLVWMDHELLASSKINDAFIVVSTNGFGDIPVNYENRYLGKTNKKGHILIPYVSAWYPAKLSIDPLGLPPNMSLPNTEQRVSVRESSGALVTFAMHKTHPLLLTLVDNHQQPLAQGTQVRELISGQSTLVGYGGQAWFDDVPLHSEIAVSLANGLCTDKITSRDSDNNLRAEKITCPTDKVSEGRK